METTVKRWTTQDDPELYCEILLVVSLNCDCSLTGSPNSGNTPVGGVTSFHSSCALDVEIEQFWNPDIATAVVHGLTCSIHTRKLSIRRTHDTCEHASPRRAAV
jgi:hypothetical protein